MLTIPELGEESLSYVFACVCLLVFVFFSLKKQLVGWHRVDGEVAARLALGGGEPCPWGPWHAVLCKTWNGPNVVEQTKEAGIARKGEFPCSWSWSFALSSR